MSARFLSHIDMARLSRRGGEFLVLAVLALAFLLGSAAGAIAGSSGFEYGGSVIPDNGNLNDGGSFLSALAGCAGIHILVLLFSTSLTGALLIPAALALRGFTLACSAAWLAVTIPGRGTALALAVLGLPSLLTVPALFAASQWGMAFSLRLLSVYRRRPLPMNRLRSGGVWAAVCVMLLDAAAIERFLVPTLAGLILD